MDGVSGMALVRTLTDEQALSVTMVLILISLANSAYLFTRFRTYDMQLRSVSIG